MEVAKPQYNTCRRVIRASTADEDIMGHSLGKNENSFVAVNGLDRSCAISLRTLFTRAQPVLYLSPIPASGKAGPSRYNMRWTPRFFPNQAIGQSEPQKELQIPGGDRDLSLLSADRSESRVFILPQNLSHNCSHNSLCSPQFIFYKSTLKIKKGEWKTRNLEQGKSDSLYSYS